MILCVVLTNSTLYSQVSGCSVSYCGTVHLPSQALRSRHRCTRQSTLAACTGANPIQDSRALQSSPWWLTKVVPSPLLLMSLVDGRCVLPEPIGWLCFQLDCPPSVAELSRLPPLKSGTLYQNTSSQLPRCSPSGVTLIVFTTTIFLSIAL